MANRAIDKANRAIKSIAQGVNANMDVLYRSTYNSTPQQGRDLQDLNDRINASIDSIVSGNMDMIGQPSISRLYARLNDSGDSDSRSITRNIENLFNSGLLGEDIYGFLTGNKYLTELDQEIDTVCMYMPKLEEALAVQKDCVLSADHFSKDFLSISESTRTIDPAIFSERCKDIKKNYKLATLVEEIYEDTSKYGERFIYRVPYKTAIGKLLAMKPSTQLVSHNIYGTKVNEGAVEESLNETYLFSLKGGEFTMSSVSHGSEIVSESATVTKVNSKNVQTQVPILDSDSRFSIGLEVCKSGVIESAVYDYDNAVKKKSKYHANSMAAMHEQSVISESKKDIQAAGNISYGSNIRNYVNDGLITGSEIVPEKVDCVGCVIKKIDRDKVIPIYIDDMCLGYYYFEIKSIADDAEMMTGFKNLLGNPLSNFNNGYTNGVVNAERQNDAVMYIAGQISKAIDKQFVNHNQDLTKEIYMILKCNDMYNSPSTDILRVVFIPPEDMIHFNFKMDPKTHRGISDLDKSLLPAKIYSSLYVTDSIGHLTRGQDKRVYYVKQTVDTNIAQTLLNTISQIKQSNFGIRQFQNINNVLNITGRFNDYVIPTNASGEAPVQFEVMPGQEIRTPTELMEQLEEMAVNATGIPIEIIQARQSVDYAMQLTMSSSKVLRWCYKRQELYQDFLSDLISSIYNYEYDEHAELKVTLPPPSFINVTNTNQLVDNTKNFVQSIIDVEMPDDSVEPGLKAEYFKALFDHYLGTHLDVSSHKAILERCKLSYRAKQKESHADTDTSSDY